MSIATVLAKLKEAFNNDCAYGLVCEEHALVIEALEELTTLKPHRAARCDKCFWALYDGDWCQNKDCVMSGQSVGDAIIYLSNEEAQKVIAAVKVARPDTIGSDAEIASLKERVARELRCREIYCQEWAESDTIVKELCAKHGIAMEHPDKAYSFKGMEECARELSDKLASVTKEFHRVQKLCANAYEHGRNLEAEIKALKCEAAGMRLIIEGLQWDTVMVDEENLQSELRCRFCSKTEYRGHSKTCPIFKALSSSTNILTNE